jgi:hypothetical protein
MANEHMNQAAENATVDRAFESLRWRNSKELSILEKVEEIPRLRKNFHFKF